MELFLVPVNDQRLLYVISCLYGDAYKRRKERVAHVVVVAGFLSRYLSGPLPYARRHITVNKM